jgi:hypothetical protein
LTVQRVNPLDLSSAFGAGVTLVHVTIETTEDPVTIGIDGKLPWLLTLNGSIGRDQSLPYDDLLNQIDDGSFREVI